MSTVTADQALQDLKQLFADLTTAVNGAANEFTALLEAIKNNNGVNPGAIETLIGQGHTLVTSLNSAVKAAQDAVNPPAPVSVSISPTSATLAVGATQQFSATVTGSANTSVTWSATLGSVDASGLYTAPAAAGTDTVIATSVADPTKSASASVSVA